MKLQFVHNNRFLEVIEATAEELQQLYNITSGTSYNFITKTEHSESFMFNNKFISAGFWFKCLAMNQAGYNVQIVNLNSFIDESKDKVDFEKWVEAQNFCYTPYDYQVEGAYLPLRFPHIKNLFDTSAGKSFIIYMYCRYLLQNCLPIDRKILIVVPRTMLVKQMPGDFEEYHEDDFIKCDGIMGGGWTTEGSNVVVGNIDSIRNKDQEWFNQFGAVIVDEGHKVRTNSVRKVMNKLFQSPNLKYVYGLSGTFSEEAGCLDDIVETAYLGPTLKKYYVEKLLADYDSVTPCEIKSIKFVGSEELANKYHNSYEANDIGSRWNFETKFVQSIYSYRKTILDIAISQEYNQVLLFNTKKFLYQMAEWAENYITENNIDREVFIISGDVDKEERERIKQKLESTEKCIVFAMYQIMDTGVSIKNLGGIHLVDSTKSIVRVRQSIGRVLRKHPNKDVAYVFDYTMYLPKQQGWKGPHINIYFKHSKQRKKIYKERKFPVTTVNVDLPDKDVDWSLVPEDFTITPLKAA